VNFSANIEYTRGFTIYFSSSYLVHCYISFELDSNVYWVVIL
jgi:hypothetical protein